VQPATHPAHTLIRRIFDPLVVLLKHCGVSLDQATSLLAESYESVNVDTAVRAYEPDAIDEDGKTLAEMISRWFGDPAYTDKLGKPRPIPLTGASPSLQSLLNDVTAKTPGVASELTVERAAERLTGHSTIECTDGQYLPIARAFIVATKTYSGAHSLLSYIAEYLHTLAVNTLQISPRPFQRRAYARRFPLSRISAINFLLDNSGMDFLEAVDEELQSHKGHDKDNEEVVDVSVHLYLYYEPSGKVGRAFIGNFSAR